MKNEVVSTMVAVDPEAFGMDASDAPRLGCATTEELLIELAVRMALSGERSVAEPFGRGCETALHALPRELLAARSRPFIDG